MVKITQAHLLSQGWVQKSFKVGFEYIKLSEYLVFFATKQGMNRHFIFDSIFIYSLNKIQHQIVANDFNYTFSSIETAREPKGLLLQKSTNILFESVYDSLKHANVDILIAQLVELVLFIYCEDHFQEHDKNAVAMHWSITTP